MVKWLLKLIVGSRNARVIRGTAPIVVKINEIEKDLQNQPEEVLKEKTSTWKAHLDRYSLRVESYSERILGTHAEEENTALLKKWAERFESLAPQFKRAGGFVASAEVARLDPAAVIGHILDAQKLFHDLKDEFPAARAAYLEQILPEAFAVVKNAARRLCGREWLVCDHPVKWEMVHFDVQLIGGVGLHRGMIAEMATVREKPSSPPCPSSSTPSPDLASTSSP